MSSAYCSEPCGHARCKTRSVRNLQETELARHRTLNHAVSVSQITLDVLMPMGPEARRIVFAAIKLNFCLECCVVRDPDDGTCECALPEAPKARICENCGEPDPYNDHWDDLDGPNRAGWGCRRIGRSLADEVIAMKKKLRK